MLFRSVFDLGVYLVVIGLTMHILHSLGGKLDEEEEIRKQRARDRARSLARKNRQRKARVKAAATARTTSPMPSSSTSEAPTDTTGTAEIDMPTEVPPRKEGPDSSSSPNAQNTNNDGKEK